MEVQEVTRGSGILLAVSSLPSPYGIGTLGDAARQFVDLLVDLKQKYWQILPVGPTSYGDSPYQTMSAFAGSPYLIDLDELIEDGLLTKDEISCYNWGLDESTIDYATLFDNRFRVLHQAFERFDESDSGYQQFLKENADWIEDYGLFMALKETNGNERWQNWPEKIKKKQPVALAKCRKALYNNIRFWVFCQYKFFEQWSRLREYANTKGVQLIGDVSFFIGLDSADVWLHQEQFRLTGGLAFEALNNASAINSNMIIILNDNEMSISQNVGGISRLLNTTRTSEKYNELKDSVKNRLPKNL